jgi:hypothetical protein
MSGFRSIGYADLLGRLPEGVGQEAFWGARQSRADRGAKPHRRGVTVNISIGPFYAGISQDFRSDLTNSNRLFLLAHIQNLLHVLVFGDDAVFIGVPEGAIFLRHAFVLIDGLAFVY